MGFELETRELSTRKFIFRGSRFRQGALTVRGFKLRRGRQKAFDSWKTTSNFNHWERYDDRERYFEMVIFQKAKFHLDAKWIHFNLTMTKQNSDIFGLWIAGWNTKRVFQIKILSINLTEKLCKIGTVFKKIVQKCNKNWRKQFYG